MPKGYPNPKPAEIDIQMRETMAGKAEEMSVSGELTPRTGADDIAHLRAALAAELAKAKELNARLEQKAEIRSEVSEALRLQQEEAKRQAFAKRAEPAAEVMPPKPEGVSLMTVKMEKNYRPTGYYEVAGWDKPAVYRKKFGHEKPVLIEAAEFIADEKAPPSVAGTGFANKIWAGTTLRLPEPEAREVVKAGIASRGFD